MRPSARGASGVSGASATKEKEFSPFARPRTPPLAKFSLLLQCVCGHPG